MKIKTMAIQADGAEEPVMVILTDKDKENIRNMDPSCTKYCQCPASWSKEDIETFMKDWS